MKVLIACEESQEVCKAFRARGHEAYSCDIQEPSGGHPEWHILGDALKAIEGGGGQTVTWAGVALDVGMGAFLFAPPPPPLHVSEQCRRTASLERAPASS